MATRKLERPKPKTWYYHYSNKSAQGALISETPRFPTTFDDTRQQYHSAYQDRLYGWDEERGRKVGEILGGDWLSKGKEATPETLRKAAQIAFELDEPPRHVRLVYTYGTNGYGYPYMIALSKIKKENKS